jgi:predicted NBD/HSP70 family sugar kinase
VIHVIKHLKVAYAGIDMGGSKTEVNLYSSLIDPTPLLAKPLRFKMYRDFKGKRVPYGSAAILRRVIVTLYKAMEQAGVDKLEAIGFLVAGDPNKGRTGIVLSGNLNHLIGLDLAKWLTSEFHCRLYLGNDVEGSAAAEYMFGAAGTLEEFLEATWSTGWGACYGRRIRRKLDLRRGESGHMPIQTSHPRPCGCGGYGHLESYVGGAMLQEFHGVPPEEIEEFFWYHDIRTSMKQGLLCILQNQYVPTIVVTGSIGMARFDVLQSLEEELERELKKPVIFVRSAFGANAGCVGGLALCSVL